MKRRLINEVNKAKIGDIYYADDTYSSDVSPAKTAIGVIIDVKLRIVVGLVPKVDLNWYKDNTDYSYVAGCASTDNAIEAQTFLEGQKETKLIVFKLGQEATAASYCYSYGVAGKIWYMGAAGEYYLMKDNIDLINSQLLKCGGTAFPRDTSNGYCVWTTTQSLNTKSVAYRFFTNELDLKLGNKYHYPVKHQQARPLFRY